MGLLVGRRSAGPRVSTSSRGHEERAVSEQERLLGGDEHRSEDLLIAARPAGGTRPRRGAARPAKSASRSP